MRAPFWQKGSWSEENTWATLAFQMMEGYADKTHAFRQV
jgi:hypothetical protein